MDKISNAGKRSVFFQMSSKGIFIIFFLFISLCILPGKVTAAAAMLTNDHYATPAFETALPVLVLEMPEGELKEGKDGYSAEGKVTAFDNTGKNKLEDNPSQAAGVKIRNLSDETNKSNKKNNYFFRMNDGDRLLGLEEKEYLLLGAMSDKSLIRNYIGYTLGSEFIADAPNIRLCELFLRGKGGDLYQGVYTLVEVPSEEGDFLFRRSTKNDGIPFETYSTYNDPDSGKLYISVLESGEWDDRYNELIGAVSVAEEVLYANDSATFYTTPEYFDLTSFIDGFVLGELTENYYGVYDCYYVYDAKTQKVEAAPLWNFEFAFDNLADEPAFVGELQYSKGPYYEQFFKSPSFTKMIQESYLKDRQQGLDEQTLKRVIEEGKALVEPAVQRDWQRWDAYRDYVLEPVTEIELADETTQKVHPFSRQTTTYDEELVRIKHHLEDHSVQMAIKLTQIEFTAEEIHKEIVLTSNPLWPILFLVAFFLLVRFVRRYGV